MYYRIAIYRIIVRYLLILLSFINQAQPKALVEGEGVTGMYRFQQISLDDGLLHIPFYIRIKNNTLVEYTNGDIKKAWTESEGEGKGSTFYFSFREVEQLNSEPVD